MAMDYFRRPQLAGKNIKRLAFGTVRGSVRRLDPDLFSSVPYFPGVSGNALTVQTQGGTTPVTFTSNSFQTILNELNTALGVDALAFDADGSVGIQSKVQGTSGFVNISGGTASVALGFNVSGTVIRSTGGDVPSSPEGRVGNPFGVALLDRGEN